MTSSSSPASDPQDPQELHRRRAVRCLLIALACAPANYALLVLEIVIGVPVLGLLTLTVGFIAQCYYGLLAARTGSLARRAAAPDRPRPGSALAAIILGLLAAVAAPLLWLYTMLAMMFILGSESLSR